ncbi:MAG: universal stress protein [Pseudomonadota bacterium]|nr:universal stress protein [Pseudomonadota bacterium]
MKRFLLPVDGSPSSEHAAIVLIERMLTGSEKIELHLLNVQLPMNYDLETNLSGLSVDNPQQERGERELSSVCALLDRAGLPYACHIVAGNPVQTIIDFAQANHMDRIVIGSRNLSPRVGELMSAVARNVAKGASLPVEVIPLHI